MTLTKWARGVASTRRIKAPLAAIFAALLMAPAVSAADTLKAVADETLSLFVTRYPILILSHEPESALPFTGSPAAAEAQTRAIADLQARLARLPSPANLSDRLLHEQAKRVLEDLGWRSDGGYWQSFAIDGYGSAVFDSQSLYERYPLRTAAQRGHYLRLVRAVAEIADGQVRKLEGQRARGIRPPLAIVETGAKAWADYAAVAPVPGEHPLIPATVRLVGLGAAEAKAYQDQVVAVVSGEIKPAAERLAGALEAAKPNAPVDVGLGRLPGGAAYYAARVRAEVGEGVTPDDLHMIGLKEVARISSEMAAIRAQLGFKGEEADFVAFIRSKPGNVAQKPEDMQRRFDAAIACVRPRLPRMFRDIPETPARAERMPEALEATSTYGWMDVATPEQPYGVYYFNGKPGRLTTGAADLIFHELWPGHHMQYESAAANTTLHPLMVEYFSSLYSEGWAQYATVVARDLGCLQNPYELYGHLQAQRMMAARLVLDTGLNAKGWSLDEAGRWGRDVAHIPDEELATELVRYGARIPAQALGYHYGMVFLLKERERARAALGDRFDIRDWHAAMLKNGDLSAGMIRTLTDEMIRAGGDSTP